MVIDIMRWGINRVNDVEERIRSRRTISPKELEGASNANAKKREKYTIDRIALHHELWVVFDGDVLPMFASDEEDVVHIWPARELALMHHSQSIQNPIPVPIPIDDFIQEVLNASPEAPAGVAIFPVGTEQPVMMASMLSFLDLLSLEWQRCN